MNDMLLDVRDLRVSFGPGKDAVTGLTLRARRGETVALVGESGCGKTLSALALAGLQPREAAVSGSAELGGVQLLGRTERQLRRIRGNLVSMVFQDASTALNPLMTVGAQIEEVMAIHGTHDRRARRKRSVELLAAVGVPDAANRARSHPHQLSGGMRQRVMIAIALAGSPDLVIADEPTTALDVTVQAQVLALLRESTRDAAVLFITHDMGVVAEIADQVVVMYAGTVVESGPIAEVLERPHHPYTAALLASVPDPDVPQAGELPTIPGRVPPLGERDAGCPFRDRCPKSQDRCRERPPLGPVAGGESAVACWYPEHGEGSSRTVEEATR
ncbi:ABC transporter ATP-binding protein [Actinacidiphila guanduensis]|uniref:Peptide/nickel transport system ATP-binding protein/peptide/nickel transport system ATP-binding protein n=1 Tax=Actinacidiphila guanduensis TaxID=310781 RepID=A0A1H0PZC6_9ACTN|nr:ABC transporter ATP-binding protein [Actinacidiphila guanduensis]SDP10463.1 peptide/nickel transport system ATP-binding protein/peptide/nickel transport system ATP-binding protein [Actinacidiphila guanduensis]